MTNPATAGHLRTLVLDHAQDLWRVVEGGPTLEAVAARTLYSSKGLEKALARNGLRWRELKEEARATVSRGNLGDVGVVSR